MHQLTNKQYEEYQRLCHARDHGQILTPDMSTCAAIYEAVQGVEKGMISATANSAEENQIFYILYPATTLEEAYEISDVLYPGMLGK